MDGFVQVIIDDSTDKVITGIHRYDRDNGGILVVPAGSSFPGTPEPGELFWRTDEGVLYRRNDGGTAWEGISGATTFDDSTFRIVDDGDNTKEIAFQAANIATSTTRTITMPDTDVDLTADLAAGTPSLRTLGTGAQQAAAGNDARLSDDRVASGLRTTTTVVAVNTATAPTSGQVLTATSGTAATWQTPVSGGETNTASNIGTDGVGVWDQKVGSDLQFRNIAPASTKVSVTLDAGDNDIDIDVVEGNIVHQNLSGVGTNTHAQIDSHIGDTTNPHGTDLGNLGSGTLAELNALVTDATLDDVGDDRTADGLRTASTVVSIGTATAPTAGQVLVATSGTAAIWQTPASGKRTVMVQLMLTENVNNTIRYFHAWRSPGSDSPNNKRSGTTVGIQNADTCSPFQVPFDATIIKAVMNLKGAGVQNGSVSYPVTYQTDLFRQDPTAETYVGDIDFTDIASGVGTYSPGNTNYIGSADLDIDVDEGELYGLKFINGNGASLVGQTRNAFITLILEER